MKIFIERWIHFVYEMSVAISKRKKETNRWYSIGHSWGTVMCSWSLREGKDRGITEGYPPCPPKGGKGFCGP